MTDKLSGGWTNWAWAGLAGMAGLVAYLSMKRQQPVLTLALRRGGMLGPGRWNLELGGTLVDEWRAVKMATTKLMEEIDSGLQDIAHPEETRKRREQEKKEAEVASKKRTDDLIAREARVVTDEVMERIQGALDKQKWALVEMIAGPKSARIHREREEHPGKPKTAPQGG